MRGRCPEGTEGVSKINTEVDQEIRAWLMIHAMSAVKPGIFTRKKAERELREHLATLGVDCAGVDNTGDGSAVSGINNTGDGSVVSGIIDTENRSSVLSKWHDFAHRYIDLCLSSRSYGSTLMNLVPLSNGQTEDKLRKEIDTVLRDYPAHFGLAEACAPLRDVMLAELDSRRKT